jgi:hypothetical protein
MGEASNAASLLGSFSLYATCSDTMVTVEMLLIRSGKEKNLGSFQSIVQYIFSLEYVLSSNFRAIETLPIQLKSHRLHQYYPRKILRRE